MQRQINATMTLLRYLSTSLLLLLTTLPATARNDRDTLGVGPLIHFTQNRGQWESQIAYRAQMRLSTLFIEKDCFTLVVQHPDNENLHHPHHHSEKHSYRQHSYKINFLNSATTTIDGEEKAMGYENFFIGNDPGRWASHVPSYLAVRYRDLYNGIDLLVHTAENAMKYDFIVAPHTDPTQIVMQYEGVDNIRLHEDNLLVKTSVLDIVELAPYAYQLIDGKEVAVQAQYRLKGNIVRIELGAYDRSHELIIDPYLHFSTYTGSTADNWGTTATYDSYKNTYTAGLVFSTGYPTNTGAYDGSYNGNADIGIFKFDTNGNQRLYATYLGGNQADMPHSMFVNSFDELLILGTTGSNNFPTTAGAYSNTFRGGTALQYEGSSAINYPNGSDLFVVRFSSDGTTLQAGTYIGGSNNDGLNYFQRFNNNAATIYLGNDSLYHNYGDGARGELITDDNNNVYVGSTTISVDFPTTLDSPQPQALGKQDGIVFKLDYNLTSLLWSTRIGGSGDDAVYSIDVDSSYNLVVAGGTNSPNLPTNYSILTNYRSYQNRYGGGTADGFVAKISRYGTHFMALTYFGSSAYDQCYFVRTGKKDDVFLFGQTKATGSALIRNATYNVPGAGQFLARLSPDLDSLVWSTTFGSGRNKPDISPTAFAVDICNRIFLCGWGLQWAGYRFNGQAATWNSAGTTGMTVTTDAYQSTTDGQDFYIMSMSEDASQLLYASFFGEQHSDNSASSGNDHVDGGTSRFDRLATLYQSVCASCGGNQGFPTSNNAWSQQNNANNCNNAIFRINVADDFPVAEFIAPLSGCAPHTIQFRNTGRGDNFRWDFGDGHTSTTTNPSHTYTQPGTYTVTLVAYMPGGCRETDTMRRQLIVLGSPHQMLDTLITCTGLRLQIGTSPLPGCSYQWLSNHVSDPNISNPYVDTTGIYTLVISADGCSDTLDQVVGLGHVDMHIEGDTVTCWIYTSLRMIVDDHNDIRNYYWSSQRDFSDTLSGVRNLSTRIHRPQQWYYAQVTNHLGCQGVDSVMVTYHSIIDTILITPPSCPDVCDGTVLLLLDTSTVGPRITWNPYPGDPFGSSDTNRHVCPGDYHIIVDDANGCRAEQHYTVPNPMPPTVEDSITHVLCLEECTGSIHLSVSGPRQYNVRWDDNGSTDWVRTNLCPDIYIAHIHDTNGCQYDYSFEIRNTANMDVTITLEHNSCRNLCSGSAIVGVTGEYPPYTYEWSNGEVGEAAAELCPGLAVVTVTDSLGCTARDTITIVEEYSFDDIHVWADDTVTFAGLSTTLHVTPIPNGQYRWTPAAGLVSPTSDETIALVPDTITYYVTVTDSIGCEYIDSVTICGIHVDCGEENIFIPNIFTPNGDGKNDELCFRGEWVTDFYIAIFNRWGELLYESTDITACWDGRYKGNICQPGVYAFTCRVNCEANKQSTFKGDITLIR